MWKILLPVLVVLLVIAAIFFAFRSPPELTNLPLGGVSNKSGTTQRVATDQLESRLAAANARLIDAQSFMQRAQPNGHGGFVEKSVGELSNAVSHMADVIAWVRTHPESSAIGSTATIAALRQQITKFNPGNGNTSPALRQALMALMGTLDQLQNIPEANGLRDRTVAEMTQAASDIIAGINFAESNGGVGPRGGRGRGPGMPGDPGPPPGRGAP